MSVEVVRVNYSVRNSRGILTLPAWCLKGLVNLTVPDNIWAGDTVQRYPLGTKLVKDDKTYRYCKAGASIATTGFQYPKVNGNYEPGATGHENVDGFEGALSTAVVAGDTEITIADTTARAENYYEGAELVLERDADYAMHHYRIIASALGASSKVKIYIAEPGAVQAYAISGTQVDAYKNRYSQILASQVTGCSYFSVMGTFGYPMVSGSFYWLQTRGMTSLVCNGNVGGTAARRMASAQASDEAMVDTVGSGLQVLGYIVGACVSGYGSLAIMLELDN